MENISDALKIAGAVLIFVVALTLTFSLISKAKTTADYIFYHTDKTNYQEPLKTDGTNREVGIADVISTIHRQYKESIVVTIVLDELAEQKVKVFNYATSGKKEEDIENEIGEYVNSILSKYSDRKFEEEFTEVPISGIYDRGEDGTEIVVSSGGKQVYVTYKLKP